MIYYTGANKASAIQGNPELSLGGWISSSQVANDFMNNLFSNIDYSTEKNDLKPIRVIAFQNTTGNPIFSFKAYTTTPSDSFAKFRIGLVLNAIDANCNCPYFEQINNEYATPFYVVLAECEGLNNAVELFNIPDGQYVGIFIQRVLIESNNSEYKGKNKSCADYQQEYLNQQAALLNQAEISEPKTEDEIQITFSISST